MRGWVLAEFSAKVLFPDGNFWEAVQFYLYMVSGGLQGCCLLLVP